ncbi:MAG: cytochrome c3 family protein [Myxococcales bacterium]|nr:cytochrome c3 family protein [Myxococcales bacterium]
MSVLAFALLIGLLGPGDVVYGGAPTAFPHGPHAQTPCGQCHGAVEASPRARERHAPPAAACVECHPKAEYADPPVRPGPALTFSHAAHAGRGAACVDCHPAGARAEKAACLGCHDGQKAPARCAMCHPAQPDQHLRTDWGLGRSLVPDGRLGYGDHGDPQWAKRHGPLAKAAPDTCDACHRKDECGACHVGQIRPLELHPADYLVSHPVEARRDLVRCATCHRQQTFCTGCHAQSGVVDSAGPLGFGAVTQGSRDYHPPGFVGEAGGPVGPEHHRHAARRSLNTCVSCHQESQCVTCHGVQATGRLRASPHPPGYTANLCRRALALNPTGCLKCHTDRVELERLCR